MWMLNMAIPGMGWQMYDYYLKPNSATFAAQKACARLLHTSYDYSAKSVWINNESLEKSPSEWVLAAVYDLSLNLLYSHEEFIPSVDANGSREIFTIGDVPALSPVYFVRLQTRNAVGGLLEDNVYWYGAPRDVVNYDLGGVPTRYADLTALGSLPVNDEVTLSGTRLTSADEDLVTINVANRSATKLAFFLRVEVTKGLDGLEVTPVTYSDNYVSLWPNESRLLSCRYSTADLGGSPAYLRVRGFHVGPLTSPVRDLRVRQNSIPPPRRPPSRRR
jgi:exo-1,4-beta-D-glucosaminidase